MDSLTYLTLKVSRIGERISIDDLSVDEKNQLISYMKKKRMKFRIYEDTLVIQSMISTSISHLFRYFLLGKKNNEISIGLLYDCWEEKDQHDLNYFKNMLDKHLQRHHADYFTFQNKLIIKNI